MKFSEHGATDRDAVGLEGRFGGLDKCKGSENFNGRPAVQPKDACEQVSASDSAAMGRLLVQASSADHGEGGPNCARKRMGGLRHRATTARCPDEMRKTGSA